MTGNTKRGNTGESGKRGKTGNSCKIGRTSNSGEVRLIMVVILVTVV